jgi:hypothetical protein
MEPTYFEVLFSKSGVSQNEHWRVIIELDNENAALLNTDMNAVTRTAGMLPYQESWISYPWGWTQNGTNREKWWKALCQIVLGRTVFSRRCGTESRKFG